MLQSANNAGKQLALAVSQLSFEIGVGPQLVLHVIKEGLQRTQSSCMLWGRGGQGGRVQGEGGGGMGQMTKEADASA